MSGWRYIAERLNGDGTATFLHQELPLAGAQITDQLSGPSALTGNVPVEFLSLKGDDGKPLLEPWSTAIYAEADGEIRGGGLLVDRKASGSRLELDCMGFTGYAKGQPYTDSQFWVEADPLDMAREIWRFLQSQAQGNLGLQLDTTTSPVRIGTELTQDEFDTQNGPLVFENGPYRLAWYQTPDLGAAFDDLAEQTPFDYREKHYWDTDGLRILHRLELGYPTLGARRTDLTFVFGENVRDMPDIDVDGTDFANGVIVLGAGEGRDMVSSGVVSVSDFRLRRIAVVADKNLRSKGSAVAVANRELAVRKVLSGDITDIEVVDHPHAPLGSWKVGDEVRVQADTGWETADLWCRILTSTISPESSNVASLTIQRTDKAKT